MNKQDMSGSFVYSLEHVEELLRVVSPLFDQSAVMTLTGSLGAGKTTLVQALLRHAGVAGPIQSPTFNYVNKYALQDGRIIYHFDLYRLHSLEEFLEAGFQEYLYQPDTNALIEWPAIVMPLLTHDVCHCVVDYEGIEMRRLSWRCE